MKKFTKQFERPQGQQKKKKRHEDFIIPGNPMAVRVPERQDFEFAMKKFKKLIKDSEILFELKNRKEYLKPTAKRRIQKQSAIRTNFKLIRDSKQ